MMTNFKILKFLVLTQFMIFLNNYFFFIKVGAAHPDLNQIAEFMPLITHKGDKVSNTY